MQKRQAVLSRNPTGSISLSFMLIKYLKIFLIRITYEYQVFLHIKISKLPVPCHQCIADILMLLRNLGGHAFLAHRRHKAADGRGCLHAVELVKPLKKHRVVGGRYDGPVEFPVLIAL